PRHEKARRIATEPVLLLGKMGEALPVSLVKPLELFLGADVALKLMAGQEYRLAAELKKAFGYLAAEHVDDHCARDGGGRPGSPVQACQLDNAIARRALIVEDHVGDIH